METQPSVKEPKERKFCPPSKMEVLEAVNMPESVRFYTKEPLPRDMTEMQIDEWLSAVPDLIEFWGQEVAKKKLNLDFQEYTVKQEVTAAFNALEKGLAVKTKENIAQASPRVILATEEALKRKYELCLVQSVYEKVEAKAKSVHKIASLRARRLEARITSPSVYGDKNARTDQSQGYRGTEQKARSASSYFQAEIRAEENADLNDSEVF